MPFRYDAHSGRFYDSEGKRISKERGLRSAVAKAQYEKATKPKKRTPPKPTSKKAAPKKAASKKATAKKAAPKKVAPKKAAPKPAKKPLPRIFKPTQPKVAPEVLHAKQPMDSRAAVAKFLADQQAAVERGAPEGHRPMPARGGYGSVHYATDDDDEYEEPTIYDGRDVEYLEDYDDYGDLDSPLDDKDTP